MDEQTLSAATKQMAQYIKSHAADPELKQLSEEDLLTLIGFTDDFFDEHEELLDSDDEESLERYAKIISGEDPRLYEFLKEKLKDLSMLKLDKDRFSQLMELQDDFLISEDIDDSEAYDDDDIKTGDLLD